MNHAGSDGLHQTLDAAAINAQVDRIRNSDAFGGSDRHREFLSYIVCETLEGRGERIKAYAIATTVFGRGSDFDPSIDPIVRVEANRLRRAMELYYLGSGRDDPIHILIPKGSYRPAFASAPDPASTVVESIDISPSPQRRRRGQYAIVVFGTACFLLVVAVWLSDRYQASLKVDDGAFNTVFTRGPVIFVAPFENAGTSTDMAFVANTLTFDIIANLAQYRELFVFGVQTSYRYQDNQLAATKTLSPAIDFILSGSVTADAKTLRVVTTLIDARSMQAQWSWRTDQQVTAATILGVEHRIADQVARVVGQPYGIAQSRQMQDIAIRRVAKAGSLSAYECVTMFKYYWRTHEPAGILSTRACLEQAVTQNLQNADIYSSLALLYADVYRLGYDNTSHGVNQRPKGFLQKALVLAQRSLDLDPNESDAYLALSIVYWMTHELEKSFDAGRRGLAISPHDPVLLGEIGAHYAMRANWSEALPLLQEAFSYEPAAPGLHQFGNFLYAYMHKDYDTALAYVTRVDTPDIFYFKVLRTIAYAELGRQEEAKLELERVLQEDPLFGSHVSDEIAFRNISPEIGAALLASLEKAGLKLTRR